MAPPLAVNGGFCEYRKGHFHAGLDLGTDGRIGRTVLAPANGWIERVRASGVGYGRSIYLHTDDGRLLVFAHLDALAEPLATHVRERQEATGQYEQDLWPKAAQFPVRAGQTLAWSGESGAGGPHLHFEIRRGDMAYHPGRAGLVVADSQPPTLASLTFEPLDDTSFVAGSAGPRTFQLDRPETLEVIGRIRAIIGARDGTWAGVDRMVPWQIGMEWNGARTECRFDSVSWATDMPEGDVVYDAGQVLDTKGIVMWAAAGFRPRVLRADAPLSEDAGTIVVRPGDPPGSLRLWARDLGGGSVERQMVLRPAAGLAPAASGPHRISLEEGPWRASDLRFASLPGGFVRMTLPETPGLRAVDFQIGGTTRRATRSPDGWSAVFRPDSLPRAHTREFPLGWRQHRSTGGALEHGGRVLARRAVPADSFEIRDPISQRQAFFPSGALFEDAVLMTFSIPMRAMGELIQIGDAWRIAPVRMPLRRSVRLKMGYAKDVPHRHLGIYRLEDDSWQWVGAESDPIAHALSASSRQLGTFAVLRDDRAPRATLRAPSPDSVRGPYDRWTIAVDVVERGSGVDARASWFEVDGRRVPTEWDPEAGQLRWRPGRPPLPGVHRVRIVVTDRAGNVARGEATFRAGE